MIEKKTPDTCPPVTSYIGPSSSKVLPEVETWASRMAELARSKMTGNISASVWPYRINSTEFLSVDMIGDCGRGMSITFETGTAEANYSFDDLETSCFEAPDMTEALTMAARFLQAAGATISLPAR